MVIFGKVCDKEIIVDCGDGKKFTLVLLSGIKDFQGRVLERFNTNVELKDYHGWGLVTPPCTIKRVRNKSTGSEYLLEDSGVDMSPSLKAQSRNRSEVTELFLEGIYSTNGLIRIIHKTTLLNKCSLPAKTYLHNYPQEAIAELLAKYVSHGAVVDEVNITSPVLERITLGDTHITFLPEVVGFDGKVKGYLQSQIESKVGYAGACYKKSFGRGMFLSEGDSRYVLQDYWNIGNGCIGSCVYTEVFLDIEGLTVPDLCLVYTRLRRPVDGVTRGVFVHNATSEFISECKAYLDSREVEYSLSH